MSACVFVFSLLATLIGVSDTFIIRRVIFIGNHALEATSQHPVDSQYFVEKRGLSLEDDDDVTPEDESALGYGASFPQMYMIKRNQRLSGAFRNSYLSPVQLLRPQFAQMIPHRPRRSPADEEVYRKRRRVPMRLRRARVQELFG